MIMILDANWAAILQGQYGRKKLKRLSINKWAKKWLAQHMG
jgi:hypothetical protein